MPFPSVVTSTQSGETANQTSHTVNMPSGVASGDLLLVPFATDGNVTVTWPAGWTEIFEGQAASNFATLAVAYRQSDGTEGASITVTTSAAEESAHIAYRITGHLDPAVQAPEVSTGASGTSATPNPDSLTPTGGAKEYLWFAIAGHDDDRQFPTYPTNYATAAPDARNSISGSGFASCTVLASTRQLSASSEDPGTFSLTGSEAWAACTVVVHPALGLTAEAGSYAWTGQAAGLLEAHIFSAESGAYAWTGQAATLRVGLELDAEAGSYSWTGQAAGLLTADILAAEAGAYVWAGQAVGFKLDSILVAEAGSYSWTGQDATLTTVVIVDENKGGWIPLTAAEIAALADADRAAQAREQARRDAKRDQTAAVRAGLEQLGQGPAPTEPGNNEEPPIAPADPQPRAFINTVASSLSDAAARRRMIQRMLREE